MPNPKGNPQNLTPWAPGTSGNPGGRPRKRILSGEYEEVLRSAAPKVVALALAKWGAKPGDSWARVIALSQARNALMANATGSVAAREMRESCEGKAVGRFEFSRIDEAKIEIEVSYATLDDEILSRRADQRRLAELPEAIDVDVAPENPEPRE